MTATATRSAFVERFAVGVDPGESTGVAIVRDVSLFAIFQGRWNDALEWLTDALDGVRVADPDVDLICGVERFVRGGRGSPHSAQPRAQRVFGAVEALCAARAIPLDAQSPSEAKLIAPDALLRRVGLYVTPGRLGRRDADDANDAVRHAVLVTARRRAATFDRLLRSQP